MSLLTTIAAALEVGIPIYGQLFKWLLIMLKTFFLHETETNSYLTRPLLLNINIL